jgi:hypothetical protein
VKFGISPFGIWRPGHPAGVSGFDGYTEIYCDSKLWWHKGWCDYLVPQIYWKISAAHQNFLTLLEWWKAEDVKCRPLCAGLYTSLLDGKDAKWSRDEVGDQIGVARAVGAAGHVHFSMKTLVNNSQGIDDLLVAPEKTPKHKRPTTKKSDEKEQPKGLYEDGALVPASTWLDDSHPAPPAAKAQWDQAKHRLHISWEIGADGSCPPAWQFAVQTRSGSDWTMHVYPGSQTDLWLKEPKVKISEIAVYTVDRCGVTSKPMIIHLDQ